MLLNPLNEAMQSPRVREGIALLDLHTSAPDMADWDRGLDPKDLQMLLRPYYKIAPQNWIATSNPDVAAAQSRAAANPRQDEKSIEEYVRQWVLRELIEAYGYPEDWIGERLVVEERVQMGTMLKEADISIKNERHKTFLYVETKNAGVTKAEYESAEAQLMGYLASTHTATIGMITDG